MIKLKTEKKGYMLDCPPNWIIAVTKSELKALYKLLKNHFKVLK